MNGIFVVVFSSNVGGVGWGLAVIENNRIHGGDLGFLYRGSIAAGQGAENIEANLEVKKYNKDAMSVFGPLSDFKLSLRGKIDQQSGGFELKGGIPNLPNLQISIRGTKHWDLINS